VQVLKIVGNTAFGILAAGGLVMTPFAMAQDAEGVVVWSKVPWLEWWHVALWAFMLGAMWWIVTQQIRLAWMESPVRFKVEFNLGNRVARVGLEITNKSHHRIRLTARATASLPFSVSGGTEGRVLKKFRLVWYETGTTEIELNPEDYATVGLVDRGEGDHVDAGHEHWFVLHGQFDDAITAIPFGHFKPDESEQSLRLDIELHSDIPAKNRRFALEVTLDPRKSTSWMSSEIVTNRVRLTRAIQVTRASGRALILRTLRRKHPR
jgi:hypothetical protein